MPHQTFYKEDMRKKRKFKRRTSQQLRSDWIKLCLCLWGLIIVKRDGCCQWCKGVKCGNARLGGHHIVAKALTLGCKLAYVDLDNGMALGWFCHDNIKHEVDEYIEFRDEWLADKGLNYKDMRATYGVVSKLPLCDVRLNFNILRAKCEGMQIPYTENKTYQRLVKRLGNS